MRSPSPVMNHRPVQESENPLHFMRAFETILKSPSDHKSGPGKLVNALSAAVRTGAESDKGFEPEDLKLIVSILIKAGGLFATGCLLICSEGAGFVLKGYSLAENATKMATRISNREEVLKPNRENLIAWLDLTASVAGLSSALASKGLKKVLEEGRTQDCVEYLAIILMGVSVCSETASIVVQQACKEFLEKQKDLSPQRKQLEYIITYIHFMQVLRICERLQ